MDHLQYLGLLVGCLVFTVPLEFIYGFRVWRDPKRLLRTVLPGFVIFLCWDLFAVHRGHWWFGREYITGIYVPGGVPIEELLFFLLIPAAGLSSFEAVRAGMQRWPFAPRSSRSLRSEQGRSTDA